MPILFLFIVISFNSFANAIEQSWLDLHNEYGLEANNSQYCLNDGERNQKKFRLASVTKIATSLYALDKLGPDFRFQTRFHLDRSQTRLHIEGSGDPYFVYENLFFLLKSLNKLNITNLQRVTFDENFFLNWSSGDKYIQNIIQQVFNTRNWDPDLISIYRQTIQQVSKLNIPIDLTEVSMRLEESYFSRDIPFDSDLSIEISSNQLISYIKEMNLYSTNFIADALIYQLGSIKNFNNYFIKKLSFPKNSFYFYTGSGLGDNYARCSQVLAIFKEFKDLLRKYGLSLVDVMAVPQIDPGTLSDRLSQLGTSVIAKTGTLIDTSTLGGFLFTNQGIKLFLIQNNTREILNARNFQDDWLTSLSEHFDGAYEFEYEGRIFHPLMDIVVSF